MKQLKYLPYIISIAFLLQSIQVIKGQSKTMYYMGAVPQSYYLNPATQPQCGFYLGLPGASPVRFDYINSGMKISDFIFKDPNSDSVIHFLHPNTNINNFVDKLKEVEHLTLEAGGNIASFGFRVQEMFFSLDASVKASGNLNYPKSLFEFLLIGNENGDFFDLSPLEFNAQVYTEIGINVSKSFGDMLSIGARPKLLFGLANFSLANENLSLTTGTDNWTIDANSELRIAAVGTTFPLDAEGAIFDSLGEFTPFNDLIDNQNYGEAFKNKGLGIDLGAHFRPYDEIQFSISILDLGFINWKSNSHVETITGSYSFPGIDLEADSIGGEIVMDSITDNFDITPLGNSAYKTGLTPKLIAGGRFFLTENLDIGLLSTTTFYKKKTTQDFTIVANLHPSSGLGISASYTLSGKGHNTYGLGLSSRVGPFNLYLISDYIPMRYDLIKITPDPNEGLPYNIPLPITYNFNIKIGLNLVFGCRKYKRLSQDMPLYNSSEWMF